MNRVHGKECRCATCRHERFNPGYPTSSRRINFYGHFSQKPAHQREHIKMLRRKRRATPQTTQASRAQRVRAHIAKLMFAKKEQQNSVKV